MKRRSNTDIEGRPWRAQGDTNVHLRRKWALREGSSEEPWSCVSEVCCLSYLDCDLCYKAEAEQGNYPTIVHGPVLSPECKRGQKGHQVFVEVTAEDSRYPLKLHRSHFLALGSWQPGPSSEENGLLLEQSRTGYGRKRCYLGRLRLSSDLPVPPSDFSKALSLSPMCLQNPSQAQSIVHGMQRPWRTASASSSRQCYWVKCPRTMIEARADTGMCVLVSPFLVLSEWLGFCSTWLFPGGWNEEISGAWHGKSH